MSVTRFFVLLLFVVVVLLPPCRSVVRIELAGDAWIMAPNNTDPQVWRQATVPGSVLTTYVNDHLDVDPYFGTNDVKDRWIANSSWVFARNFSISEDILITKSIVLRCEGIDTIATVYVNNKEVGTTDNMFVRYIFNVKHHIKLGNNSLMVVFQSAVKYAEKQASLSKYVVPPQCPPNVQHGECHVNFVRKEQSSFSWDWGPAFAPIGIWKDIYLEVWNSASIRDVIVLPLKTNSSWQLNTTVYVSNADFDKDQPAELHIQVDKLSLKYQKEITLKSGEDFVLSTTLDVEKPELWWPNGYGAQPLYAVSVKIISLTTKQESQKTVKVGFRTVRLIEEPVPSSKDKKGLSFFFEINGLAMFLKGSNWIPADAFQERVNDTIIRDLLTSAKEVHINVLRVWGGGIYERDSFYQMTDELGIMIWQDFMFACATYPTNPEFIKSVTQEVEHQVRRLASHPSIIVWAGNNENEKALAENWYNTSANFSRYKEDYVQLYIDTIWPLVRSHDGTRPFLPSSPTNGQESVDEGGIAKKPSDTHYGDNHFYDYASDCWNVSIFPHSHMASEYGYQSWPSLETLQAVSEAKDWAYNSSFSDHRQHHQNGNQQMMAMIKNHFKLPTTKDSLQNYTEILYLTQVVQAMCIKTETEFYRRNRNQSEDGQGGTMGALYWQLNDIWQAPSWSSIEYGGKWKMLHYFVGHFFSPILPSAAEIGETLHVTSISDNYNVTDGKLTTKLWSWNSFTPLKSWTHPVSQKAGSTLQVYSQKTSDLLTQGKCSKRQSCFFTFELQSTKLNQTCSNFLFLSSFSDAVGLKIPNVTVVSVNVRGGGISDEFIITLQTDAIAPFTWLEAKGVQGHFSDNGFLMLEKTKTISFYVKQLVTKQYLKEVLQVTSLMNLYST